MAPLPRAQRVQVRGLIQEHNNFIDYAIVARMHDAPRGPPVQNRLNAHLIERIENRAARIWVGLPQAERDGFEQAWNALQAAKVTAGEDGRVANEQGEAWTARLRDEPQTIQWHNVHHDMIGVARDYHNVGNAQQLCVDLHNHFVHIVGDTHGEITAEYARRGLRRAQRRLAQCHAIEARWRKRGDPAHPPIPLRNGKRKLPEMAMPAENDAHRKHRHRRHLSDRQDGYLDEFWEGAWPIGEGGMGVAALWIKENERGQISERIVRKDAYLTRRDWADATKWDGNARDGRHRVPMEAACHRHLEASYVPALSACFSDTALMKNTLYMQYCGLGTLIDVMKMYYPETAPAHLKQPIPEPFLWRVFLNLAEVGQAMYAGAPWLYAHKLNWEEIIHRDLKPDNVFLDLPEAGNWEAYPTPYVGDFGLAIRTMTLDPLNPQIFLDQGWTEGFRAPEQLLYVEWETRDPIDRFQLTSKTNVWGKHSLMQSLVIRPFHAWYCLLTIRSAGVGKTMFSLAALEYNPRQPHWYGQRPEDNDNCIRREYRDWMRAHYSDKLARLIDDCLVWDPRNRPSFETILTRIYGAISDRGEGMQGPLPDGFDEDHPNALIFPEDTYRVNMARILLPDPDV